MGGGACDTAGRGRDAGRAPREASGGGGRFRRAPGAAARGGGPLRCAPARVDASAAAMQLTVKALQGRECSLQVASLGWVARSAPPVRDRAAGGDGPGGLATSGEPPSARAAASPPAHLSRPGQVSEDELVSTLKHLVSEKLNIPVRQQRLLFKGKALAGNQGEGTPGETRGKPGDGASSPGPGSSVGGGGSG